MSSERTLLIATGNNGKVVELRQMLSDLLVDVVGLGDLGDIAEVPETGSTFLENAKLKAVGYARQSGLCAIADDSGLEVASLGGRPGVHSARYGGEVPFTEKMRILLAEVGATNTDRGARFVSSLVLARPDGTIIAETEGVCPGRLALEPRGSGGFGYDPIFIPDGHDRTFGELPEHVKAQISHRSRAFSQMMPFLSRFFGLLT